MMGSASMPRGRSSYCSGMGTNAYERNCIVPDLIDRAPRDVLQIRWNNTMVNNGNEIRPEQAVARPIVSWNSDPNRFYAISFSDLDSPTRQNSSMSPLAHGLVLNIPGGDVTKGEHLLDYIGPQPVRNTGLHRYVMLIFQQPGRLNTLDPNMQYAKTLAGRVNFEIRQFAQMFGLGDPVAGNFFVSRAM